MLSMVVVLPAPLRPTRHTASPSSTRRADVAEDLSRAPVGDDAAPSSRTGARRHGPPPMRLAITCSFRRISSGGPSARIVPWCMATIRSE